MFKCIPGYYNDAERSVQNDFGVVKMDRNIFCRNLQVFYYTDKSFINGL